MVGNSLASPHVEIMTTFSKPFSLGKVTLEKLCRG
jgi:hypothetical protein